MSYTSLNHATPASWEASLVANTRGGDCDSGAELRAPHYHQEHENTSEVLLRKLLTAMEKQQNQMEVRCRYAGAWLMRG